MAIQVIKSREGQCIGMLNIRKRKALLKSYAINQAYFISKRFYVQTLIRAELSIISKWVGT